MILKIFYSKDWYKNAEGEDIDDDDLELEIDPSIRPPKKSNRPVVNRS